MAQLVSERSGEVVTIPDGENHIGRGPLLKVTDKRVSRNHAMLHHEKGKLRLCPKHRNPCFYKPAGQNRYLVLDKDVWQELHDGDCFSLLPNECVFQVVIGEGDTSKYMKPTIGTPTACSALPSSTGVVEDEPMDTDHQQEDYRPPVVSAEALAETPVHEPNIPTQTVPASIDDLPTQEAQTSKKRSPSDGQSSTGSTSKARSLPSWLKEISATSKPQPRKRRPQAAVVSKVPKSCDGGRDDHPPLSKVPKIGGHATPLSSSEKKEEVRLSGRGEDNHVTTLVMEQVRLLEGGEDSGTVPAAASVTGDVSKHVATKKTSDEKTLPLCPYGSSCYRKNPQHFREYSHSFSEASGKDDEEDDSDKPLCPYGADCYQRNLQHRKEYKHAGPPATATGTRSSSRTTKGKKHSVLDGDSDDDDLPNTYDRNDSFIDDEDISEESSYGDDSEDSDWALEKTDGRAGTPPDEDIAELLNDAEEFISSKKMRRTT